MAGLKLLAVMGCAGLLAGLAGGVRGAAVVEAGCFAAAEDVVGAFAATSRTGQGAAG